MHIAAMRNNKDNHINYNYGKDDFNETYNNTPTPFEILFLLLWGDKYPRQLMRSWGYPAILIVSAILYSEIMNSAINLQDYLLEQQLMRK